MNLSDLSEEIANSEIRFLEKHLKQVGSLDNFDDDHTNSAIEALLKMELIKFVVEGKEEYLKSKDTNFINSAIKKIINKNI